jgi:hypothetical protein
MRLFISWSGGRSHRLAIAMKVWLEHQFPGQIKAFVSSDIEKGTQWFPAVERRLRKADAGLFCLTPESLRSDWILFEAGALATAVAGRTGEARIFTYLLDLAPESLPGPLAAYQSTVATMEDTRRLVNALLKFLEIPAIDPASFAGQWRDLQRRLDGIGREPVTGIFPRLPSLFQRKTFNEPVDECMDQSWFQRYDGAVATREALRAQADLVAAECGGSGAEMYRALLAEVDGYAMDLRALLFKPRTFELTGTGRRDVPSGVRAALERRRMAVHRLAAELTDPAQQPLVPKAYRFDRAADPRRLVALHYSLRWLLATPWRESKLGPQVSALVAEVRGFVEQHGLDAGGQLHALLAEFPSTGPGSQRSTASRTPDVVSP